MRTLFLIAALLLGTLGALGLTPSNAQPRASTPEANATTALPPHVPRFGRSRPVVAVVGENRFTELTDYVVPYGVLHASGVAEVVALATQAGPIQMFPALKIRPHATVAEFDVRFPQGADYVIVPAVHHSEDAALLAWVTSQAAKGATIVGVCDGVWVLAHAGLLKGHQAVGHWYAFDGLKKTFPDTAWVRDRRYLADGKRITTTGVSASIPVSLALVEAIGGPERAAAVARAMGVADWGPTHRSSDFQLSMPHMLTAAGNWLSFWSHEEIGMPVANGMSEVALALAADAYSRTYRSNAVAIAASAGEVRTRGGLSVIPDRFVGWPNPPSRTLAPLDDTQALKALDLALQDIAKTYGRATAAFVALQMEYPQP